MGARGAIDRFRMRLEVLRTYICNDSPIAVGIPIRCGVACSRTSFAQAALALQCATGYRLVISLPGSVSFISVMFFQKRLGMNWRRSSGL